VQADLPELLLDLVSLQQQLPPLSVAAAARAMDERREHLL
jgi:hypothetical protein